MKKEISGKKIFKDHRGVSLVEVLIALTILSIVTVAVTGMFYHSAQMEKKDHAMTEASHIAVSRLEAIKRELYTIDAFNTLKSTEKLELPDNLQYVYDIDVATISTSLKYVGVTVYFRNLNYNREIREDVQKPNLGKICKMGTYVMKP